MLVDSIRKLPSLGTIQDLGFKGFGKSNGTKSAIDRGEIGRLSEIVECFCDFKQGHPGTSANLIGNFKTTGSWPVGTPRKLRRRDIATNATPLVKSVATGGERSCPEGQGGSDQVSNVDV